MSVAEIKACSFWEFYAAVEGFLRANPPPDEKDSLTSDDETRLAAFVDARPVWERQ